MMTSLRSWLREPRVENPPRFVWRDAVIVAACIIVLIIELFVRDDINAPVAAVPAIVMMAGALPWRRTYPLRVAVGTLGGVVVFDIVSVIAGYGPLNIYAAALLLIVMYSTFRWGSGRDMVIVSVVGFVLFVVSNVFAYTGVVDTISGLIVLEFPPAIALAVRYVSRSREQTREQIRITERESLARDLHDTVAHHMSAIAIQAQAGRFVAESGSLQGAADALEVIEEEASRTLAEMRSIVGVLRTDTSVAMAPQHGVSDIESLASATGVPVVNVLVDSAARGIGNALGAALYRIAQESITNARRHATDPTTINVHVNVFPGHVRLVVVDDGAPTTAPAAHGFGLIGMSERATLLGGTLSAGPAPTKGWQVVASLPLES